MRTIPLEFKDTETGEHFDVVQDDDLAPDPGEELGDEDDRARGVHEGGARGPTVRPALTVPYEIKDEATGEVLDVIQDNDPLPSRTLRSRPLRSLDPSHARR